MSNDIIDFFNNNPGSMDYVARQNEMINSNEITFIDYVKSFRSIYSCDLTLPKAALIWVRKRVTLEDHEASLIKPLEEAFRLIEEEDSNG